METVSSSEIPVGFYQTTRRHMPENNHRRENVKSNIKLLIQNE
jgi:hypothetical protein